MGHVPLSGINGHWWLRGQFVLHLCRQSQLVKLTQKTSLRGGTTKQSLFSNNQSASSSHESFRDRHRNDACSLIVTSKEVRLRSPLFDTIVIPKAR